MNNTTIVNPKLTGPLDDLTHERRCRVQALIVLLEDAEAHPERWTVADLVGGTLGMAKALKEWC